MIEKMLSLQNRISRFRTWFSHWFKFLIDLIITHARICRLKLKLYAKTLFYFTVNSIQLLIVLFLSFIFRVKSMVEIQVKKILSFIYIFSISILHCIYDLIRSLINYMNEKVLSIKNKIIQFGIWFSDWLEFMIDISLTHARICRFKSKLYAKTFFYFTVNSIQLLIALFLSFIFCSQSMFEMNVIKLLSLIYIFLNYILKSFNDSFVMFINYLSNNMFRTHNRVESINL